MSSTDGRSPGAFSNEYVGADLQGHSAGGISRDAERLEAGSVLAGSSELLRDNGEFEDNEKYSVNRATQSGEQGLDGPDISSPGPDLASFPNSPYTLPRGHTYVEVSPFSYAGSSSTGPEQYNTDFLLRYGIVDQIELRLFGNGITWTGGSDATSGFSPIGFDTKILMWSGNRDYYLPAVGFEASIQTEWLGSSGFNAGTQPSFNLNFDQPLPFDMGLGYTLSATRSQDLNGENNWSFILQWALQRTLFREDFSVFLNGFYQRSTVTQHAIGGGFIWNVNRRFAVYGQASGGTTRSTPSFMSHVGFAIAF